MRKLFIALMIVPLITLSVGGFPKPATAEVIELKWTSMGPPQGENEQFYVEWGKRLEEKSGGRVKCTYYFAESLVKSKEQYEAVEKGICDVTVWVTAEDPVRLSLHRIVGLPALGIPDSGTATRIFDDLFAKYPQMGEPFANVKVLWKWAAMPRSIHMVKKEIRVPDDFKGVKMLAFMDVAKGLAKLGAAPVTHSPGEWYMDLDRGLVEGAIMGYWLMRVFKVSPLLHYHTEGLDFGYLGQYILMNRNTWNRLPADVQELIDNELAPWGVEKMLEINVNAEKRIMEECKARGDTFIEVTPKERKLWYNALKSLHEEWIADNEAKGAPAQDIYNDTVKLIKKYSK